ncbi:hypothetical protein ACTXT7_007855 [Hymenolepis weldensis]
MVNATAFERSVLVDDKCKQPEELCLVKPQDLPRSPTNTSWSHIDLSLPRPIREIPYLILVDSYAKWPQVRDDASRWYPNVDPTKTYLDARYHSPPWNPGTTVTQRNHQPDRYTGLFRRPQKRFTVDPTLKCTDK